MVGRGIFRMVVGKVFHSGGDLVWDRKISSEGIPLKRGTLGGNRVASRLPSSLLLLTVVALLGVSR